jgi:hypothetical protein
MRPLTGVALLLITYFSIHVTNVLVRTVHCKFINFVFHIFPVSTPKMPAGFITFTVQITSILFGMDPVIIEVWLVFLDVIVVLNTPC